MELKDLRELKGVKVNSVCSMMCAAVVIVMLLSGCKKMMREIVEPSEKHVKKEYKVDAFEKIKASATIKMVYTQTEGEQKVVVDMPENLADKIEVEVSGKELKVNYNSKINGDRATTVYVEAPCVRSFKASSASTIVMTNGLKADREVAIQASSAASIRCEGTIEAKLIYVDASSAATIGIAEAKAETIAVEASSAASADISNIDAETLSAKASSAATITLDGQYRTLLNEESSAGEVNAKRLKAKQQ